MKKEVNGKTLTRKRKKYDQDKNNAPQVVAKGKDFLAQRIVAIAEENDVYTIEDPPLARSLYSIPVDVRADDALLTLSTCLDDDRLVILARRLRDGETEAGLRAQLGETVKR